MHEGGKADWVTKGDFAEAWAKVGFTYYGIKVDCLLKNPLISGTPQDSTKFQKRSEHGEHKQQSELAPEIPTTPKNIRRNSQQWRDFDRDRLKSQLEFHLSGQATIFDKDAAQIRTKVLADTSKAYRATQESEDLVANKTLQPKGNPIGDIMKPQQGALVDDYLAAKRKRKAEEELAAEKAKKKAEDLYRLKVAYLRCSDPRAACSCGHPFCVAITHYYCEACDQAGRTCIQKSKCCKQYCSQGKLNAAERASTTIMQTEQSSTSSNEMNTIVQTTVESEAGPARS